MENMYHHPNRAHSAPPLGTNGSRYHRRDPVIPTEQAEPVTSAMSQTADFPPHVDPNNLLQMISGLVSVTFMQTQTQTLLQAQLSEILQKLALVTEQQKWAEFDRLSIAAWMEEVRGWLLSRHPDGASSSSAQSEVAKGEEYEMYRVLSSSVLPPKKRKLTPPTVGEPMGSADPTVSEFAGYPKSSV